MRTRIPIVLAGVLGLAACGGGIPQADSADVATLVAEQVQTLESTVPTAAPPRADAPAPAADSGPTVVFQPDGSFTDAERDEIMRKVIDPFVHYHRDLEADGQYDKLVSILIRPSDSGPEWMYSASAIFADGVYSGWLMPATDGVLDWWLPECFGVCEVSEGFRAAYPEIMAILEP